MREEDQPPEEIWLDDDALSEHFDHVRARYASEAAGNGSEPVPDPRDFDQNELTKGLR